MLRKEMVQLIPMLKKANEDADIEEKNNYGTGNRQQLQDAISGLGRLKKANEAAVVEERRIVIMQKLLIKTKKLLNQLKSLFSRAYRILKSAGKKLRCIKNFQEDWLIFFAKMHYYLARLFGVVNSLFGKLQHHNVLFAVVANFHNGSFLQDRK